MALAGVITGNGTVKDMTTGLIWLQNAHCTTTLAGATPADGYRFLWADARIWSSALVSGQCGLSDGSTAGDWRLPTKKELNELANGTESVRAVTPRNFLNVISSYYWSSASSVTYPGSAWAVGLCSGPGYDFNKTYPYYVWAVRGGQ